MYNKILNDLRFRRNINTDEIANYLGISRNLYNMYEREAEIFPIKYLNKVCNFFDVSLDYIFGFVSVPNYKNNRHVIDRKISGERLKKIRLSLNLNQEHIADILGVSTSNISKYEMGLSTISTFNLYMLCNKFNISTDYLLGKTDEPKTINVKEKDVKWRIEETIYMYSDRLKYLRESANLKREDLANILGIHVKRYTQYEREYDIFPLKHLNTLCIYFNVSFDYLFGFNNKENYENLKKDIDLKKQAINLKLLRKNLGFSMNKIGKSVGTTYGSIRNYESGKTLISTKILYKICKKYDVSADYILGKVDEPKKLT